MVPFGRHPRPLSAICSSHAPAAIKFSVNHLEVEVGTASVAVDDLDATMIIILVGCCLFSVVVSKDVPAMVNATSV